MTAAARVLDPVTVAELGRSSYLVSVDPAAVDVAPDVKDAVYPLAADAGARVVVDIATAACIDDGLVGVLIGGAHLLRCGGGELVIVARDPRAATRFRERDLGELVRVETSLQGALRA